MSGTRAWGNEWACWIVAHALGPDPFAGPRSGRRDPSRRSAPQPRRWVERRLSPAPLPQPVGHLDGYRTGMAPPILLCTDGSHQALGALSAGLDLLGRDHHLVLVSVMDAPDEGSLAGSGHAGPEMSLQEHDDRVAQARAEAESAIGRTQSEVALPGAEVRVVPGEPGPVICQLAAELSAQAIVIGSRGRGGLKRMVLGSVSDYVVRNAPCSVVVTRV